ncbi:choice-of-anchor L domain-containing protein [Ferruginibacter sp. SUN106]|uniref:choice-of-anchor L domain-containing protein n=1 Tax=Ferruginibacter sp. SUN106 TaxID=2978348 RepID=UPI003D36FEE0
MRAFPKAVFFLITGVLFYNIAVAQLQVISESNAQALVQKLLGAGVTVSNIKLIADPMATGLFNNLSGTKIGIGSGIVLTNGKAKTGEGLNDWGVNGNGIKMAIDALANTNQALPGDGDLARLLGIPKDETHDACVLEFDFVPLGDTVKFNYVFGSEEYPDYVCQFNDVFAFFISGPGFPVLTNIALIPGTTDAVTINHVNDGATCSIFYPQYYVKNYTNTYFTYNGHTTVLTAVAAVQPCQTYHLKLAIADVGDGAFDSGVFLEAKSLSSNAISLKSTTQVDQQNNSYLVEGCSAGSFKVKRPEADLSPLSVTLSYGGTAVNGVDYQLLPTVVTIPANQTEVTVNIIPVVDNIPEGIETLKIYALAGCNPGAPSDSSIIQIRDYDTLGIAPDTAVICKHVAIQLTASAGYTAYQWDANPMLSNLAIRNPVAQPTSAVNTYYCTATQGTCHGRDSALVIWKDLDLISKTEINCKNYSNGEIRVAGGPEWTRPVQYSINNSPYQDDSTFTNLTVGIYTVRIKDAAGCIDSLVINITQLYPDLLITSIPLTPASCSGNADGVAIINVTGGSNPYLFSADGINFQNTNVLHLNQGNYPITVRDNNNCTNTQNIIIPLNNTVTLVAGPNVTICEGKNVQLNAISNGASFVWTPATALTNNLIRNPVATPVLTTKYVVSAITGICSQKDSLTIFVNPAPRANAGSDHTICFGQNIQLNGSGGLSYFWSPASYLDDARIATPTAKQLPGSISYFLNVTDINGCVSLKRDTTVITVTRPAIVNAGTDTTLAIGQALPLFAKDINNIGFTQYEWTPAYGLSNPAIANPVTTLDKDITYTVTARNSIGCQASDNIKIKVYKGPDIYVPNAFSPNNDGSNDILKAIPAGIKDFHYFRIYNRWGNIVFTTGDSYYGWDGKINGSVQQNGTYIWIAEGLDYKGNIVQRKGTVIIVK